MDQIIDRDAPKVSSFKERLDALVEDQEIVFNYFVDDETRQTIREIIEAVREGDWVTISVTRSK